MEHPSDQVIDLYRRHAAAWTKARANHLFERGWLDRFDALLPRQARILDLGCGSGVPIAQYLAGLGHRITGVDSAPEMIERFRAGLPGQEGLVGDMRTLSLKRRFDGILAWNSFFHLSHSAQRAVFGVFEAHSSPGTALMFTSGSAFGETLGTLEGDTLYHASLAPGEYRDRLHAAGFKVINHIVNDANCGNHTIWLARHAPHTAAGRTARNRTGSKP